MVTSKFVMEIDRAIETGQLHEPFRAQDVREAFKVMRVMPPFAERTFNTFLGKHALGSKQAGNKYFQRVGSVGSGLYRRLRN